MSRFIIFAIILAFVLAGVVAFLFPYIKHYFKKYVNKINATDEKFEREDKDYIPVEELEELKE